MRAFPKQYHTSDPGWRIRIRNYLRAGFGVEDISLKLKGLMVEPSSVDHIRDYVHYLRETGEINSIVRKKRDDKSRVDT